MINKVIKLLYWVALFITLAVAITIFAPKTEHLILWQYIILFSPRYSYLFLCLFLLAVSHKLSKIQRYSLPLFFLVGYFYIDIQINFSEGTLDDKNAITLVTANLGEGSKQPKIEALIKFYNPDILLLQEAGHLAALKVFKEYPFRDCKGNLCFISKYKFTNKEYLDSAMFSGYGKWAAFYEIELNKTKVNIANIHFPSVRKVFNNFNEVNNVHENRIIAAGIINEWASTKSNVIIAGDFNMSVSDSLYRRKLLSYKNAISSVGHGFNTTVDYKYRGFSVPGIRVDHILLSKEFNIEKAIVLETLGGDHYPVLSKVSFNGH